MGLLTLPAIEPSVYAEGFRESFIDLVEPYVSAYCQLYGIDTPSLELKDVADCAMELFNSVTEREETSYGQTRHKN